MNQDKLRLDDYMRLTKNTLRSFSREQQEKSLDSLEFDSEDNEYGFQKTLRSTMDKLHSIANYCDSKYHLDFDHQLRKVEGI